MWKIGLKTSLAHKRRLVGTASSVLIGIAFLAGTLVFTDTIKRSFDDAFTEVYEKTDAYVRSADSIDTGFGGTVRGRIPDSTVADVMAVPGVSEAVGYTEGFARIIDADGDPIGVENGAPQFGQSAIESEDSPWIVKDGRLPTAADEVAIDAASFDDGSFALGDQVTIVSQGGTREFTLTGTVRFGSVDSVGGATFALFTLPTAQEFVTTSPGEIDAVLVSGDGSVSDDELAASLTAALPDGVEALTGAEITDESIDAIEEGLSFFNILLIVFAGIALFVGAFIIYNTFSITVAQRQQESAVLRAVGASRRQVLGVLLIEAAVVGLIASILGFVGGLGMAVLLEKGLNLLGIGIPAGGLVVGVRTAVVSLVVGLTISIAAALLPALRGSRVPPVAAMREVNLDRSAMSTARLVSGLLVTGLAIVLIVVGLTGTPILLALGAPLVFIGVFVLGPILARPVAGLLGRPVEATRGITGRLARANATRNPRRTARTAAALMVGVALVAGITVLAASVKASIRTIIAEQFTGDYVVSTTSFGFGGIPPEVADRLNELPEVESAAGIQVGYAAIDGTDQAMSVVDPQTTIGVFDLEFVTGDIGDLTVDGVLVSTGRAESAGLSVGDPYEITMLDGVTRTLTVQGIYEKDELAGPVSVHEDLYEQSGADQYDFSVFVTRAEGVAASDADAAIAAVVDDYANADLQTRDEYVDSQVAQIDQLVNLMYGLLALAVVIAVLGIANTLSLSVYERTRELGLLRAVGASRRQVRGTVRWESIITALLGAVQGLVIGVLFGYAVIVALRDEGLESFSLPVVGLIAVVLVALVAGVVAAIKPARRAARLDILRAVTVE
jgi:putative ABC transport system permease protein